MTLRTLLVGPEVLPFSFSQGTMTSGQPITVQCIVVDGDLPMTLRWMFHGRELSSQMGVTTFRLNPRVSLLSIDAVAAAHAGDYTCTAENAAGIDSQSATLLVQGQLLTDYQTTKKKLSCALFFQPFPSFLRSAKLVIKHLKWQSCKKPFHSFNWKWNQVYVPPSLINLGLISNCISSLRLNRMKTKSFTSKIYQLEINFCTCIDNTSLKESLQIGSASESGAVQLRRRNNNIGTSYHGTVYSYWWRFAHDFALDVPRSRTFIANGSNDVQTQPSHVFVVHRHRGRCPRWWLHVHSWECCWYRQPICNTFSPGSALHRR